MHALILDTDARAVFAIGLMLKSGNIGLDRVASPEHALELDSRHRYAFWLLGLAEPDASVPLLCRMRAICLTRPMLVLSGADRPEARHAALAAGADGYMLKPFHRRELLAHLRGLLLPGRHIRPVRVAAVGIARTTTLSAGLPPPRLSGRFGSTPPLVEPAPAQMKAVA